jgi:antitoxin (DNA-binding transcriptional repressor) of toxin-antitoxin stability system
MRGFDREATVKLIKARELRADQIPSPADRIREDLVLTLRGKPVALVWPVNEDNLEESLKMARLMRSELQN